MVTEVYFGPCSQIRIAKKRAVLETLITMMIRRTINIKPRELHEALQQNRRREKTKARHPQTNGICERFHRTMKDEFYSIAFRKKIYNSIEELQQDVGVLSGAGID